jgi:putative ABC transport system ATP-binding protein
MASSPHLQAPHVVRRPAESALLIRDLVHRFGDGASSRQVLFGVDLAVEAGEVVFLTGPSGCGKTSVLTLAAGLRAVQGGSILTLGTELRHADEASRVRVRRRIGFVFQSHHLHASLTARENVGMGLEAQGKGGPPPSRLVDPALEAVGLLAFAEAKPAQLSGGQKQRVAIARALVALPSLILADEPTAALDGATGRGVVDLIRRMAKRSGSAVLLVTHDPRLYDAADRVIAMDDGRILSEGGPQPGARATSGSPGTASLVSPPAEGIVP